MMKNLKSTFKVLGIFLGLLIIGLAIGVFGGLGCQGQGGSKGVGGKPGSPAPGKVLAKVDGHKITQGDIDRMLSTLPPRARSFYSTPHCAKPKTMIPKDISSKDNALQILWSDGHRGVYPFRDLRLACPCANCLHEWTREKILDPKTIPNDIKVNDASYVGHYALSIDWSDGHNTGIYTFEHLRKLCQCAECKNL